MTVAELKKELAKVLDDSVEVGIRYTNINVVKNDNGTIKLAGSQGFDYAEKAQSEADPFGPDVFMIYTYK